jgi:hypothetical protein
MSSILTTLTILSSSLAVVVPGSIPQESMNLQNNQHTTYPSRPRQAQRLVSTTASATLPPVASTDKFQTILVTRSPNSSSTPRPSESKSHLNDHLAYHVSGAGRREAKHTHQVKVSDEQNEKLSSSTVGVTPTTTSIPRIVRPFGSSTSFPTTTKKIDVSKIPEEATYNSITDAAAPTTRAGVKSWESSGRSSDSDAKSEKIAAKGGFRTVIVRRHEEL